MEQPPGNGCRTPGIKCSPWGQRSWSPWKLIPVTPSGALDLTSSVA